MNEILDYFKGDDLAASVWQKKYALRDENENIVENTPNDMHRRLAKGFAKIEQKYDSSLKPELKLKLSNYGYNRSSLSEEDIFNLFKNFKYIIPGGSVMYGLGQSKPISLSNCFVTAPPKDSMIGIFKTCAEQASLFKRRGGDGYDISSLRPNQAKVNNSAHYSTGSVSFMDLFSQVTKTVGELNRRGALLLSMFISHPDAEEFILKKQDLKKVTEANVSIQMLDDFMEAVIEDKDYIQKFPIDSTFNVNLDECKEYNKLYSIKIDENICYFKKVKAKELWHKFVHCAWNTAEPGLIYHSRMINYSPDGLYPKYRMISTNPCGEIGMGSYDSCRLIHVNLTSIIKNPFTNKAEIDEELLYKLAYETLVLGDDLVDLEIEAINKIIETIKLKDADEEIDLWENINKTAKETRRCGVGFTGLADAIAMLNIKYCSEESFKYVENIMRIIFSAQLDATIDLGILRGPFEGYDKSLEIKGNDWFSFVEKEFPNQYNRMMLYGRRNISFSTVAPTGTVSLLARCSSGIEPVFLALYKRNVKCNSDSDRIDFIDGNGEKYTSYIVIHPALKEWAIKNVFSSLSKEEIDSLPFEKWEDILNKSPWKNATASEISWMNRVKMQGLIQKYITHSISSTINLPKETTEEEIEKIFLEAWKFGNKGQTVYRDGCRDGVLNSIKKEKPKELIESKAPKRPDELEADYYEIKSKGIRYAILVGIFDNKPYEIFAFELNQEDANLKQHKGKIIKIGKMHYRFVSDLITIKNLQLKNENVEEKAATLYSSMLLRHGVNIKYIIKTAKKVNDNIASFSSAICRVLSKYIPKEELKNEKCPECGGRLVREGSCIHCIDCGYSKCL